MTKLRYKNSVIDGQEINIPFAIINEKKSKSILITGGIDGDEYVGIKAAFKLINDLDKIKSEYRIIIVPLVNVFGNKIGVSHNPFDGKYPKYIYPGKKDGTSSEQLIYQLEEFINECFLWIDLHSGSTEEKLNPFIWTWKTKNKNINEITRSFLSNLSNENIIYQDKSIRKIEELAKRNISYLMLESGELGKENINDILKHVDWVKKIISKKSTQGPLSVYKKVQFYKFKNSEMWKPEINPGKINEEKLVGILGKKKIISNKSGLLLYMKKSMILKKDTELFAIAYEKVKI